MTSLQTNAPKQSRDSQDDDNDDDETTKLVRGVAGVGKSIQIGSERSPLLSSPLYGDDDGNVNAHIINTHTNVRTQQPSSSYSSPPDNSTDNTKSYNGWKFQFVAPSSSLASSSTTTATNTNNNTGETNNDVQYDENRDGGDDTKNNAVLFELWGGGESSTRRWNPLSSSSSSSCSQNHDRMQDHHDTTTISNQSLPVEHAVLRQRRPSSTKTNIPPSPHTNSNTTTTTTTIEEPPTPPITSNNDRSNTKSSNDGWSYSPPTTTQTNWNIQSHNLLTVTYTPSDEAVPEYTRSNWCDGITRRLVEPFTSSSSIGSSTTRDSTTRVRGATRKRHVYQEVYTREDVQKVVVLDGGGSGGGDSEGVQIRGWPCNCHAVQIHLLPPSSPLHEDEEEERTAEQQQRTKYRFRRRRGGRGRSTSGEDDSDGLEEQYNVTSAATDNDDDDGGKKGDNLPPPPWQIKHNNNNNNNSNGTADGNGDTSVLPAAAWGPIITFAIPDITTHTNNNNNNTLIEDPPPLLWKVQFPPDPTIALEAITVLDGILDIPPPDDTADTKQQQQQHNATPTNIYINGYQSWSYAGSIEKGAVQPTSALPDVCSKAFNYGADVPPPTSTRNRNDEYIDDDQSRRMSFHKSAFYKSDFFTCLTTTNNNNNNNNSNSNNRSTTNEQQQQRKNSQQQPTIDENGGPALILGFLSQRKQYGLITFDSTLTHVAMHASFQGVIPSRSKGIQTDWAYCQILPSSTSTSSSSSHRRCSYDEEPMAYYLNAVAAFNNATPLQGGGAEFSSTIDSHHNHSNSGRLGEAARIEQLIKSQNITGTKNYRPLVGGFAAHAYEAMKEHHYLNKESRVVYGRAQTLIPMTMTGWCSWYHYFEKIDAETLDKNFKQLKTLGKEIPSDVAIIDDGYITAWGDWDSLKPSEFPTIPITATASIYSGCKQQQQQTQPPMKLLADSIRANGIKPGLWLAPFACDKHSQLAKSHPDWIIKNDDGRPTNSANCGKWFYGLDATNPAVRAHATQAVRRAVVEWGYEVLKLDFLYAACLPGNGKWDLSLSRAEAMDLALGAVRAGAGEGTFLIGCGCPLGSAIGYMDAMRISADTNPTWYPQFPFPKWDQSTLPSLRAMIRNSLTRACIGHRWWHNDPDCLLLGDTTDLSREEVISAATVVGMTGGMLLVSDDLALLKEERVGIVKRIHPGTGVTAVVLDLHSSGVGSGGGGKRLSGCGGGGLPRLLRLWCTDTIVDYHPSSDRKSSQATRIRSRVPVVKGLGTWSVVSLSNWHDSSRIVSAPVSSLLVPAPSSSLTLVSQQLSTKREEEVVDSGYHVFTFWSSNYFWTSSAQFATTEGSAGTNTTTTKASSSLEKMISKRLGPHESEIFHVKPVTLGVPQYIGSDIHFTCGYEVASFHTTRNSLELRMKNLYCRHGFVYLFIPITDASKRNMLFGDPDEKGEGNDEGDDRILVRVNGRVVRVEVIARTPQTKGDGMAVYTGSIIKAPVKIYADGTQDDGRLTVINF